MGHKKTFLEWHWLLKLIVIFALCMGILALASFLIEKYLYGTGIIVSPVADAQETVRVVEPRVLEKTEIISIIVNEFSEFGSQTVMTALRIANCESKFDERAEHWNTNGTVDRGIYQINSIHRYADYELFGAYNNILIAKRMFVKNGHSWSAWSCK